MQMAVVELNQQYATLKCSSDTELENARLLYFQSSMALILG